MNKIKVLVTGGAGFIGSNLVDELIKQNYEVIVLDDLSTGNRDNLNPKADFYEVDISGDLKSFIHLFKGVECVFHLAAWARVARSVEDPVGTNKVNVGGGLNILQACRQLMIPRLVMSSSSSVYGDQPTHIMSEKMKDLNPLSPYALQKLTCEKYAQMFAKLYGTRVIALRYFNVYGYRQVTEGAYSLVIGKFIAQKARGENMTIFGDGSHTRAYTHVSDVVRANILAMTSGLVGESNFEAFNIGTGEETSVNQIAEMLGGEYEHIMPHPRGNAEEARKVADYTKAKTLLGWEPTVFIKEGISCF